MVDARIYCAASPADETDCEADASLPYLKGWFYIHYPYSVDPVLCKASLNYLI